MKTYINVEKLQNLAIFFFSEIPLFLQIWTKIPLDLGSTISAIGPGTPPPPYKFFGSPGDPPLYSAGKSSLGVMAILRSRESARTPKFGPKN